MRIWQINVDIANTLLHHRPHEQGTSDSVVIVDSKQMFVGRELDPERSNYWFTGTLRPVEQPVPVRQQAVPGDDRVPDGDQVLRRQQPRFAASGVEVGVGAEKRLERCRLEIAEQQQVMNSKPFRVTSWSTKP